MNKKIINVAIIGAGENAVPIIKNLVKFENFKILGVTDEAKDAPGLAAAKELGINTNLSLAELVKHEDLNFIIETSGSPSFINALRKMVAENVTVMDESSVLLMLELTRYAGELIKHETTFKVTKKYSELVEEANKKLDDKIFELALLNDILSVFSSALDSRNVAAYIFTFLKKKIDFSVFALLLFEERSKALILAADKKIPLEIKEEICLRMCDRHSKHIKEKVDPKSVAVIEEKIPSLTSCEEPMDLSVTNLYTTPLTISDSHLGLMGIVFCKESSFAAGDENFLKILAAQLALFLESDRIRRAMIEERNKLESILRSMNSAVLVVDSKNNILLLNLLTESFLGIKIESVLGRNLEDVISQDEIKFLFSSMEKQKSEFLTKEIKITNPKDGFERAVKANMARMHDYLGNTVGIVLVLNDITREKELDRMKTDFISIASHELRTPLASIKEAVALVFEEATGPVTEKQREFLGIAKRNIDRLAHIVNNLLDLSKIESGKVELKRFNVNINDIAKETVITFESLAKDKKIELKVELDKELPQIQVDQDRITQVVVNLVSNALKFTERGGTITVKTGLYGADKNFVEVSVQDTGAGIEKKDIDKLFQKFQQLDSSTTRKAGGTGLGLVICKQIIELHGGRIWVESEPGKGSKFIFVIPLTHIKEKSMKKKILVIDDEADICSTIKMRLELRGFDVLTALSGQEGLDRAKEYNPELIILDLMMPVMDGFKVCRNLKKDVQTSSIPVVALTALEHEEDVKKAFSMGADGYLVKPFEEKMLLFTIEQFLNKAE